MKHQKNLSATISPSDIPNIDNEDQIEKECEPSQDSNSAQKSPRATTVTSSASSTTVVTSPTINKSNHLYNQHTESSLSKSRNSGSSRQPTASSMAKRWPSINSVSTQQAATSTAAASSAVSSIKPVSTQHLIVNRTGGSGNSIKPHRTESSTSTIQQSTSRVTNDPGPSLIESGPVSLKKASSMTNVNAGVGVGMITSAAPVTTNKQTFVSSRPLPAKMSNKDTMLPPKTSRTSTLKSRTLSNNLAKSQPAPVTLLSTFSEQNNKIKKLSSSIQNLHNAAAAANNNKHIMNEQLIGSKILADRDDDKKKETSSSQEDTDDQMSTASSQNMDDEDMMIKSSEKSKKQDEENECCDLDQFTSNQLNSHNSMTTSSTSSSSSSSSSFCANEEASNTITAGTTSECKPSSMLIDHDEIVNPFMTKKLTFKSRLTGEMVVEPVESTTNKQQTSSGSSFSGNMKSFKKPVTFASIATGSSNTINILGSGATSSSSGSTTPTTGSGILLNSSGAQCSNSLSNSKIETILKEFKENIYFFEMIYGQV